MKTRLKVAGTLAILLISLVALSRFFAWMNQPSDSWLYLGALGALLLVALVPAAIVGIWRTKLFSSQRP